MTERPVIALSEGGQGANTPTGCLEQPDTQSGVSSLAERGPVIARLVLGALLILIAIPFMVVGIGLVSLAERCDVDALEEWLR